MKKYVTLFTSILLLTAVNAQYSWIQKGNKMKGEGPIEGTGISVSTSGDGSTIAVGANLNDGFAQNAGHVRVYTWQNNAWVQKGADIEGEAAGDQSGNSVALNRDGTVIIIGAYYNGNPANTGHARVYIWNGSSWVQRGVDINGTTTNEYFGWSVAISATGDDIAVGGYGYQTLKGVTRAYTWNGTAWVLKGTQILGENGSDRSGYSISLSNNGNKLAIGAIGNYGANFQSFVGHVRVYAWNGANWTQQGADIDGTQVDGELGYSVELSADGNTLIAGAPYYAQSSLGKAFVYEWNGSSWMQKGSPISFSSGQANYFGKAVAMTANASRIAVYAESSVSGTLDGLIRVYDWDGNDWLQSGYDLTGPAYAKQGASLDFDSAGAQLVAGYPSVTDTGGAVVFKQCTHTAGTDVITSCSPVTWINGQTYSQSIINETWILPNASGCDSLVTLQLTINSATSATQTVSACGSYTWMDGNTYTEDNSSATHILTNSLGCDSVVTLNLTILPTPDITVTQTGNTLTASVTDVTYAWGDCNSGNPIPGATDQTFTATQNGDYAVFVMDSLGCFDTSACYSIVSASIPVIENSLLFVVGPNPFNDHLQIDFPSSAPADDVMVELFSSLGELVKTLTISTNGATLNLVDLATGIYFLRIRQSGENFSQTLIKE